MQYRAGRVIGKFGTVKRNRGPNVCLARRSSDRAYNLRHTTGRPFYRSPPRARAACLLPGWLYRGDPARAWFCGRPDRAGARRAGDRTYPARDCRQTRGRHRGREDHRGRPAGAHRQIHAMTKKRRVYRPRIVGDRVMMPVPSLLISADGSAGMPDGGSGHADTINSGPTRAAGGSDLRDHAVRLMKRRERHSLRRCCEGQPRGNSDQPDHSFLP
jgi:hypothetical protein